LKNQNT